MVFSHDMKWGAHIDSVLHKAFTRLNGIRSLKDLSITLASLSHRY